MILSETAIIFYRSLSINIKQNDLNHHSSSHFVRFSMQTENIYSRIYNFICLLGDCARGFQLFNLLIRISRLPENFDGMGTYWGGVNKIGYGLTAKEHGRI